MTTQKKILTHSNGLAYLQIWLGNFFEPFYSNKKVVMDSIADILALKFNVLNTDTKPWADFFDRYQGKPASVYVDMQESIFSECRKKGLPYSWLALYFCGDNLYPTIRDVPPVRGEDAVSFNGESMQTYKYWSPAAQESMVTHVKELIRLYGKGYVRFDGSAALPVQTMFDPIVRPSFDKDGQNRYINWLKMRYKHIDAVKSRYHVGADDFHDLDASLYWYKPENVNRVINAFPEKKDYDGRTGDLKKWVDNQDYLAFETVSYFEEMKKRFMELETPVYTIPNLQQWGMFFTPPGALSWDTTLRAVDPYAIGEHVDGVMFISSPLNAENEADAYAFSAEAAMMRAANQFEPFIDGIYFGRHVSCDVYRDVSPAETIATSVAAGSKGYHVYGYSGLDDGGVFYKMDDLMRSSVVCGNEWTQKVAPRIEGPRVKECALLFPRQMFLYEPLSLEGATAHRMDLLGYYKAVLDSGYHADMIHPSQVKTGVLDDYKVLILPVNSCYDLSEDPELEKILLKWTEEGGTLIHGPYDKLVKNVFKIDFEDVPFDCIKGEERIIPHGERTAAPVATDLFAQYEREKKTAIGVSHCKNGKIFSFGFEYGYAYARRTMPAVPESYGRLEAHPVVLLKKTPLTRILNEVMKPLYPGHKGIEYARFKNALVVVNHRSIPFKVDFTTFSEAVWQYPIDGQTLLPHSAVCFFDE